MCTTDAPALFVILLVATLLFSIMYGAADGLQLRRQVRGASDYEDILAGNDFLSVFLDSTLQRLKKETTTEDQFGLDEDTISTEPYMRETRGATNHLNELTGSTESSKTNVDSVIIAVHVSSSVGSKKKLFDGFSNSESTTSVLDRNLLPADRRNILANSGESELSVDESTPVSKNGDLHMLQAGIQHIPYQYPSSNKPNTPRPFHHSLIYHNNPNKPGRARSVSYSTIIQNIHPSNEKPTEALRRMELNFETGTVNTNLFEKNLEENVTPDIYLSTTTTAGSVPTSDSTKSTTTNKNWSTPYTGAFPKVYGRQEQNYEVDESVSVVTNGRTHGIQNNHKSKDDKDKDQKIGYVVEGRNYRKYRVEERTPDGFIVGEYGVVSHDDGSLRGVRYTADGTINPRLIYDALMKFLAL